MRRASEQTITGIQFPLPAGGAADFMCSMNSGAGAKCIHWMPMIFWQLAHENVSDSTKPICGTSKPAILIP